MPRIKRKIEEPVTEIPTKKATKVKNGTVESKPKETTTRPSRAAKLKPTIVESPVVDLKKSRTKTTIAKSSKKETLKATPNEKSEEIEEVKTNLTTRGRKTPLKETDDQVNTTVKRGRKPVVKEKEATIPTKKERKAAIPEEVVEVNGKSEKIEEVKTNVTSRGRKAPLKETLDQKLNTTVKRGRKAVETEKEETKIPAKRDRKAAIAEEVEEVKPKKDKKEVKPKKGGRKLVSKKEETEEDIELKKDSEAGETVEVEKTVTKAKANKTVNDFSAIDYGCTRLNEKGQEFNLKIACWNVGGLRSWITKGCLDYIKHEEPDIICLQEVKCSTEKLPDEIKRYEGYHAYWFCAKKDGYSGVALLTKRMPIEVYNGIGDEEHDNEARIITAEYKKHYVCCVYVPNSGRGLVTLDKRLDWNKKFNEYIDNLNKKKPVIICGDMNVAHKEIDLKNPKTNKKTAGFTQEERDGMTEFLSHGYVDIYRKLYPDKDLMYTFWTYMSNARAKNVGWRVDYFLVSEQLVPLVCDNIIRSDVYGSDHCPLVLYLNI